MLQRLSINQNGPKTDTKTQTKTQTKTDTMTSLDDLAAWVLQSATDSLRQYDLRRLAAGILLPGVSVLPDPGHSRARSGLRYVMILYEGQHIGTVYPHTIRKDAEPFDAKVSKSIWDTVEKYASS